MGVPQNGWFIGNILLKWMIWGYPYFKEPAWPAGLLVLLQLSRANAQMVAKDPDAITRQMESKGLLMHYISFICLDYVYIYIYIC